MPYATASYANASRENMTKQNGSLTDSVRVKLTEESMAVLQPVNHINSGSVDIRYVFRRLLIYVTPALN